MNLLEPRWTVLFAKLVGTFPVVTSSSGRLSLDLSADERVAAYESTPLDPSRDPKRGEDVPGGGRADEGFVDGVRQFGLCLSSGRGQLESVGTMATVRAYDVLDGSDAFGEGAGNLMVAYAVATTRFRVLSVHQELPYTVADVELLDDPTDEDPAADAELAAEAAELLGGNLERLYADESPKEHEALLESLRSLDSQSLAGVLLRGRPRSAQAVLASATAAERRRLLADELAFARRAVCLGLATPASQANAVVGVVLLGGLGALALLEVAYLLSFT